jgi:hypothetical protein
VSNIDQQLVIRCGKLSSPSDSFGCYRWLRELASLPIRKEHHMPDIFARPEPSLIPIARPRCPTCQGRMVLTSIEPGRNNPDLRTFECSKCELVYKVLAEDQVKSAKT